VGQPGLPELADDLEAVVDDLIGDLGFTEFTASAKNAVTTRYSRLGVSSTTP
jgi:hypothetical protein